MKLKNAKTSFDAPLQKTYESEHDFRAAFSTLLENTVKQKNNLKKTLTAAWINTPLGPMIAMADDNSLYLLEFITRIGLERELKRLAKIGFSLVLGNTSPLTSIESELNAYFSGTLYSFKTPYQIIGSPFQQQVWKILSQIPFGETISYKQQAENLGKPTAYRAVANANGANQLAIIVPCHRVIASTGHLGGYGGGLTIKQWLLKHEAQYK
jgi:AraC family transcriptional regulator, regulatory protein of adaptative response / methylated-DNA-[protein]-cysteine methyltransferase